MPAVLLRSRSAVVPLPSPSSSIVVATGSYDEEDAAPFSRSSFVSFYEDDPLDIVMRECSIVTFLEYQIVHVTGAAIQFLSLPLLSLSRCNDIEEETVCGKKITTHVLFLPREALI